MGDSSAWNNHGGVFSLEQSWGILQPGTIMGDSSAQNNHEKFFSLEQSWGMNAKNLVTQSLKNNSAVTPPPKQFNEVLNSSHL